MNTDEPRRPNPRAGPRPGWGRDEARSVISAPSAASGGVPEPSAEYLAQAALDSKRLEQAQPMLIVVDLNGTILHRPHGVKRPKIFVHRPHAFAFLDYMVKNFWVVVWSSARPDNVKYMCRMLLPTQTLDNVVAVWDRSHFGLTQKDYNSRTQCYKRLTKLWDNPDVARSHPQYSTGGRWSQANTVLIDDSIEKARSEPYNAITVPEFDDTPDLYDMILPQVHDYIHELCYQSDVSAYIRVKPFEPVTDQDSKKTPPKSSATLYARKHKKRAKAKARKEAKKVRQGEEPKESGQQAQHDQAH
ncbi:hypothetical protein SEUCBS139899_006902 [Sporothrix eucalyptigena]|uniref:Mitochondrial import inner membrane translocase subunit TIM50 n=1 Tax=Sporothrix eucalyptigena TaxID=1812306 RepID=A0ABP0AYG3_9PEZI